MKRTGHALGELDAAPHGHEIDVVGMTVEKNVSHVSSHHIDLAVHFIGYFANLPEHRQT